MNFNCCTTDILLYEYQCYTCPPFDGQLRFLQLFPIQTVVWWASRGHVRVHLFLQVVYQWLSSWLIEHAYLQCSWLLPNCCPKWWHQLFPYSQVDESSQCFMFSAACGTSRLRIYSGFASVVAVKQDLIVPGVHIGPISDRAGDLVLFFHHSDFPFPSLPVCILWAFFHWGSCVLFLTGF